MKRISLALYLGLCFSVHTHGFTPTSTSESFSTGCTFLGQTTNYYPRTHQPPPSASDAPPLHRLFLADVDSSTPEPEAISVIINTTLSESNTQKLFAWIKCAFDSDEMDNNDVYAYYYNNIELAIAAAFGANLPENSLPSKLLEMAMKKEGLLDNMKSSSDMREWEETLIGEPIGKRDRESASLGAMGAAQWTGQWMTRPHCECCNEIGHLSHVSTVYCRISSFAHFLNLSSIQHCWMSEISLPSTIGSRLCHEGANEHLKRQPRKVKTLQLLRSPSGEVMQLHIQAMPILDVSSNMKYDYCRTDMVPRRMPS